MTVILWPDMPGQTTVMYQAFMATTTSGSSNSPPKPSPPPKPPAPKPPPLEIYPNPAQQSIILKTASEESSLGVSIYDLLGRAVLQQNILNGGSVEMASLANGLYHVVATTPSGEVFTGKLRKTE